MSAPIWTKITSTDDVKRSSQTLAVINNRAYIFGGEIAPREPVDADVFVLDLKQDGDESTTNTISVNSESPQPRVGAASTTIGDKMYIFSGRGGTAMKPIEELGAFWVFDPKNDSWSRIEPEDQRQAYPAGRSYHSLTSDGQNMIFLHAGCPEKGRLHDLWSFDVSKRQWQELSPAPGSGRGGTSVAVAQGRLYRMNGFDGKTEQGGTLDVFDPAKNEWTSITYDADGVSGPTARSVCCLLSVKVEGRPSLVTMFGESDPSNLGHQGAGKMLSDIWVFDIESKRWTKLTVSSDNAPQPRGWFDADVVQHSANSKIVVHGGLAESNERIGDAWVLSF